MKVELVPAHPNLAPALFAVVDASRDFLGEWLTWTATTNSVADEVAFLAAQAAEHAAGTGHMFVIRADGHAVGGIDLHNIDAQNRHAEVGYFLGRAHTGQGIMHTALVELENYAFGELGLHKLTIVAAKANVASRRVAERAGYDYIGDSPAELYLHERYYDAAVYVKIAARK
ncbi:GNAT family N-acetyltransferase [Lacticaseibacillus nasuensis]|uniref:N-acetyltransferase domain-containing protein n=1 Tax=Lacticaseibacillus nasuensis JCM 17158 TaxID=1291734 RepID=A0A0R1JSP9_9LACO|nr:GNAT family N-acetyltransferase [Lacticaseibacillus nasuensis]KRK74336.1 hypothetical protein FD02_GL000939 [Lacticaseibacillus nasuensis JCM 17158]